MSKVRLGIIGYGNMGSGHYNKVLDGKCPEITVTALSEEVGKLAVEGETDLQVGDRILIIPNHACSAANLTAQYFLLDDENRVTGTISVDIRSKSTKKGTL